MIYCWRDNARTRWGLSELSDAFKKTARVVFLGTAANGAARFLYIVLVGRYLGVTVLGSLSVLLAIVVTIGGFISFTIGDISTKFVAELSGSGRVNEASRQFSGILLLFLLSLAGISGVFIISFLLQGVVGNQSILNQLLVPFVLASVFSLNTLIRAGLFGFGLVKEYSIIEIGMNSVFLLMSYCILIADPLLYLAPLLFLYCSLSIVGFCLLASRRLLTLEIDLRNLLTGLDPRIFSSMGVMIIIGIAGLINGSAPIVMQLYLGPAELGYYAAASSFLIIVTFLPIVFNRATLPTVSYEYGTSDTEKLDDVVCGGLKVIIESPLLAVVSVVLYAPLLIELGYGAGFETSISVLRILVGSMYVAGIATYLYNVLVAISDVKKAAIASVISTISILLIWLTGIPIWGIHGAAFALMIGALIRLVAMTYWARKKLHLMVNYSTAVIVLLALTLIVTGILYELASGMHMMLVQLVLGIVLLLVLGKPMISAFRIGSEDAT